MVNISFDTDNDSFRNFGFQEIAKILKNIAENVSDNSNDSILEDKRIRDENGNVIGTYSMSIDVED